MINWSRLPILILAALLCFVGGARVQVAEGKVDGYGMMAAGFIFFGVWVTLEIQAQSERRKKNDGDADGKP